MPQTTPKLAALLVAGALACSGSAADSTTPPATIRAAADPDAACVDPASAPQTCDPEAAWEAFEGLLREAYAYVERDDFDVEGHLARAREATLSASGPAEVRRALLLATYAFTDPHLLLVPLSDADPNVIPTSSDLMIEVREDRFVVAHVRADSAAAEAGVRPGWELLAAQGEPIGRAVGGLVIGGSGGSGESDRSTPRQRSYAATLAANGLRGEARSLSFRADGEERTLQLANPRDFAREVSEREPLTLRREQGLLILRFENSLGSMETVEALDRALGEASADETIVLDLRNTPSGGNTDVARGIIGHFVTETRPYQMHRIPGIERRHGVPREFIERVAPREPLHSAPVLVLGGPWTGSMGEGIVIGMDGAAGAHTIASDMGDLLGAIYNEPLGHCDASLELGVESLFHIDGTPREDYVADTPLAIADLDAAGEDPALAAVREVLARGL